MTEEPRAMHAIISLCHFCETHGPRVLFSTYDGGSAEVEAAATAAQPCVACGSIGRDTALASRADDGFAYYSRESLPDDELNAALRQAAVRSLTCESSWNNEGGCMYFGEGGCHVLSHTFQLHDSRARGLKRWFACLVLMKDRIELLNHMPFFSEHMKNSADELKELARDVFEEEQRVCSQRALRLTTGHNDFGPARNLQQLTGVENIFHSLHIRYSWLLNASSRLYSERHHTSEELLSTLHPSSLVDSIYAPSACEVLRSVSLRTVREMVGEEAFRIALYCLLTGVEVTVESSLSTHSRLCDALGKLSAPGSSAVRLVDTAQPPLDRTCLLRYTGDDNFQCQWTGSLPSRCPTLMIRIEEAMDNVKMSESALEYYIKSCQMEWLGIANTLRDSISACGSPSHDAVLKLKTVLGVGPHDLALVDHWIRMKNTI